MQRPKKIHTPIERDKIWQALRTATRPLTISDICTRCNVTRSTASNFLRILADNDYASREDDAYALMRDTGPRCPAISTSAREIYDWNLNPEMTAKELQRIYAVSGATSLSSFCRLIGFRPGQATRIGQMMRGERDITAGTETRARAYQAQIQAGHKIHG